MPKMNNLRRLQQAAECPTTIADLATATGIPEGEVGRLLRYYAARFQATQKGGRDLYETIRLRRRRKVVPATHQEPTCLSCGATFPHAAVGQGQQGLLRCDCGYRTVCIARVDGYQHRPAAPIVAGAGPGKEALIMKPARSSEDQ